MKYLHVFIFASLPASDADAGCQGGSIHHIDGFVQERRNSSALAMELRLSCTNPSIYNVYLAVSIVISTVPADGPISVKQP